MSPQAVKNKKLIDIYQALIDLLQIKSEAAISITELCTRAQVSRTYYYRNFSSFDDIIKQFEILSIVQYMRNLPHQTKLSVATMIGQYFELAANMADAQLVLINTGKEAALIDAFTTAFLYLLKHEIVAPNQRVTQKYWAEYIAGAVINMSIRWLKDGQPETPTYMGQVVAGFVNAPSR